MTPRRSTPVPTAPPSAGSAGESSEVRVLAASRVPAPVEPLDAQLAWLDAQLAEDMLVDESAIDLLAIADDESARPIQDDELTPPRPSAIPGSLVVPTRTQSSPPPASR